MDLKEAILSQVNIADVIGQYVALTMAGRELKGSCPFHDEKAASFHVNTDKGLFHCFGCKAGGNVIDFVMRIENLEFVDALEWLANKYGIQVPKSAGQHHQQGVKERLYSLNEAALKFFRTSLKKPEGETAAKYLERREIGERQASEFDLGYAPREWQALTDLLLSKGAKSSELVALGLIKQRQSDGPGGGEGRGFYDAFRHRLIFPIRGVTGRVIGFAGRALSDEDNPKYLNVTNTPLYDKSSVLYNLNRAKGVMRDEGAVIVEGYMDVIGLARAGVENAVATCGTALTEQHVKLLARYTDRFFLAFDGDEAGVRAAWSAGMLFLRGGHDVRVIALPRGIDPDDLVRERGREAWLGLLSEAVNPVRFWLDYQQEQFPQPDLPRQRKWVQQLSPLYTSVPDELSRQQMLREVANALRLGAEEVGALLRGAAPIGPTAVKLKRDYKARRGFSPRELNANVLYARDGELSEELLTRQEIDKAQKRNLARHLSISTHPLTTEREVTRRLVAHDAFRFVYLALALEEPVAEWFADSQMRAIFELLAGGADIQQVVHSEEHKQLLSELLAAEPLLDSTEQLLTRHRNLYYQRREVVISAELRRAITARDEERQAALFQELKLIKQKIKPVTEFEPAAER
ncbi:DNA primase [bacterium]|nr:DNA primase [bacterium]